MSDCLFPAKNTTRDFPIYQQGFSLLEMVLVLLIMGMVASLSVVFIDNEDGQLRYEESVKKLEAMHKATVADYKDGALYSGFVVDNGTLPTIAKDFISSPTGWIQYGETYTDTTTDPSNPKVKSRVFPYFRLTKKDLVTTLDNTDYSTFIFNSTFKKFYRYKGYRSGYIGLGIDSEGDYKNGWGRPFTVGLDTDDPAPDPEDNTASFQDFELAINAPEASSYNEINRNVTKDNWSVALTDIVIEIENKTLTPPSPINNIIIGLSVFTNKAFIRPSPATGDNSEICKDCWTTYHIRKKCIGTEKEDVPTIEVSDPPVTISAEEDYIWQTEALEKTEHDQTACEHADNVDKKNAVKVRIPAGEHIVFVGVDANTNNKIESTEIKGFDILEVSPRFPLDNIRFEIVDSP